MNHLLLSGFCGGGNHSPSHQRKPLLLCALSAPVQENTARGKGEQAVSSSWSAQLCFGGKNIIIDCTIDDGYPRTRLNQL